MSLFGERLFGKEWPFIEYSSQAGPTVVVSLHSTLPYAHPSTGRLAC